MKTQASERLNETEAGQLRAICAAATSERSVAERFHIDRVTLLKGAVGMALSHGTVCAIRAVLNTTGGEPPSASSRQQVPALKGNQ